MKLNFHTPILSLSGKPAEEFNEAGQKEIVLLDRTVGQALSRSNAKTHILKFMGWAEKFWNGSEVEIDVPDSVLLKEFIEAHDQLTVLTKAQALRIIDAAKDREEKQKLNVAK